MKSNKKTPAAKTAAKTETPAAPAAPLAGPIATPVRVAQIDEIIPATPHIKMSGFALQFAEATTLAEWTDAGKRLSDISKVSQWLIGDWLNFGQGHFKKDYKAAVEKTGLEYGTCRTAASVAKRFPAGVRHENLQHAKFEHHRLLAPIKDDAKVAEIIARVEKDKLSAKAMLDTDEYKNAKPPPKELTPEQKEAQAVAESERMREKAKELKAYLAKVLENKALHKRLAMWVTPLRELTAIPFAKLQAIADAENENASKPKPAPGVASMS